MSGEAKDLILIGFDTIITLAYYSSGQVTNIYRKFSKEYLSSEQLADLLDKYCAKYSIVTRDIAVLDYRECYTFDLISSDDYNAKVMNSQAVLDASFKDEVSVYQSASMVGAGKYVKFSFQLSPYRLMWGKDGIVRRGYTCLGCIPAFSAIISELKRENHGALVMSDIPYVILTIGDRLTVYHAESSGISSCIGKLSGKYSVAFGSLSLLMGYIGNDKERHTCVELEKLGLDPEIVVDEFASAFNNAISPLDQVIKKVLEKRPDAKLNVFGGDAILAVTMKGLIGIENIQIPDCVMHLKEKWVFSDVFILQECLLRNDIGMQTIDIIKLMNATSAGDISVMGSGAPVKTGIVDSDTDTLSADESDMVQQKEAHDPDMKSPYDEASRPQNHSRGLNSGEMAGNEKKGSLFSKGRGKDLQSQKARDSKKNGRGIKNVSENNKAVIEKQKTRRLSSFQMAKHVNDKIKLGNDSTYTVSGEESKSGSKKRMILNPLTTTSDIHDLMAFEMIQADRVPSVISTCLLMCGLVISIVGFMLMVGFSGLISTEGILKEIDDLTKEKVVLTAELGAVESYIRMESRSFDQYMPFILFMGEVSDVEVTGFSLIGDKSLRMTLTCATDDVFEKFRTNLLTKNAEDKFKISLYEKNTSSDGIVFSYDIIPSGVSE